MQLQKIYLGILAVIAALFLIGSQALFIVDERETAIVLQLGEPIGEPKKAGLHVKLPFVQDVRRFDGRVLTIDPQPTQMVISNSNSSSSAKVTTNKATTKQETANTNTDTDGGIGDVSGEPIVVDTFGRYVINDPLKFLKTLQTLQRANARIEGIIEESTRSILGSTTLRDLLSDKRENIMQKISLRVNEKVQNDDLGVKVVDVRIVRADLTPQLRQSTVRRMISELQERAKETRAQGREQALEIRATADKEKQIILANAQRDSEIIRGEGDEKAIRTYANAYNADPEFFAFWRSMQAYKASIDDKNSTFVLSPDSKFFKYFDKN